VSGIANTLLSTGPVVALLGSVALLGTAVAVHFATRLRRLAGALLAVVLVGYAVGNKAFAYIGVPPLFIGEFALMAILMAALLRGKLAPVLRSGPAIALLAFLCVGFLATAPYLSVYGLDAMRDAVLYGYGLIALAILSLGDDDLVGRAAEVFVRCLPVFLAVVTLLLFVEQVAPGVAASLTFRGVSVVPKHGDVAVHLAGIGAFMALGLNRVTSSATGRSKGLEWLSWGLWIASFALISDSRGGMLAVLIALFAVWVIARKRTRFWKLGVLVLVAVVLASSLQVQLENDEEARSVSVSSIVHLLQSSFVDTGDIYVDGTKAWRLQWWSDILNYTVLGPYRWLGKGYGVNLADDDGFQVLEDESLRSPHSAHMSVLARSGVIGTTAWLAFLAALLVPLVKLARHDSLLGARAAWLLAYLVAALVNASFDVYLEGPQGGIWFWSLVGVAMTYLYSSRYPAASERESSVETRPVAVSATQEG